MKLKKLQKVVKKVIKKDARKEALKILLLADKKYRKDFLKYHKQDKDNICCLVLDDAKGKLVSKDILKQKKTDFFGKILNLQK